MPPAILIWCVCGLLLAPFANARSKPPGEGRQSIRSELTTTRPGSPAGTSMWMRFRDPANADGKPYSVDQVVIKVPRGMRFDNAALPQCTASDVELMARGEAACPAGSNVQRGELVLDTGSPLIVPRLMRFSTATFNADGGLVSIGESEDFRFRGVVRSRISGRTVTVDYADAPGFGGPDSQSAMKTMFTSGPPLVRAGRAFMRTPPRCLRSRRWTTRYTFIYQDGVRQTELVRAPCRPKKRRQ